MARDTSNGIVSEPKFVAAITYELNNGLCRILSKFITQKYIYGLGTAESAPFDVEPKLQRSLCGVRSPVCATAFCCGHLTRDFRLPRMFGLLPPLRGCRALRTVGCAAQSLAFTFLVCALALILVLLSCVCYLLSLCSDPVSLVGDAVSLVSAPISLVSNPLARQKVSLALRENLLALIEIASPRIEFTRWYRHDPSRSVIYSPSFNGRCKTPERTKPQHTRWSMRVEGSAVTSSASLLPRGGTPPRRRRP
jgi:hypothetical protein